MQDNLRALESKFFAKELGISFKKQLGDDYPDLPRYKPEDFIK